MTKEKAMTIIKNVCAEYKGTAKEHATIYQAINVINDIVFQESAAEGVEKDVAMGEDAYKPIEEEVK